MQVSRETARKLMIEKQGLTNQKKHIRKNDISNLVDKLGCIQIDTINVVERAHHLTLWSRLGNYQKNLLHDLAYIDREVFEHWAHALCFIPFKDYRYYISQMKRREKGIEETFVKRSGMDPAFINQVYNRVTEEGPLSSSDFEGRRTVDGWANWKPAKLALELLYRSGKLLIHHRSNFQKHYDIAENIIPSYIDTAKPSEEERVKHFIFRTLKALGLVTPQELRKYYHTHSLRLGTAKQLTGHMNTLVKEREVEEHKVEESKEPYYCLSSDLDRIMEIERGDFDFTEVKMLSYFDNLLWLRERVNLFYGFEPKFEVFIPKKDRIYGFYHMPVLYGDRLVARIEPKMERSKKTLIIRGYWEEEGFKTTEEYEDKLQETLESFAAFNSADEIEWNHEKSG